MCLDVASKLFFILMCVCRNGKEKGGRGGRGKEWRGVERDGGRGKGWREGEGMERGGEGWREGEGVEGGGRGGGRGKEWRGVEGGEGWWGSGNKVRFMTKS